MLFAVPVYTVELIVAFAALFPIHRPAGVKLAATVAFATLTRIEFAVKFAILFPTLTSEVSTTTLAPTNTDEALIAPVTVELPATVILLPNATLPVMFAVPATVNLLFLAVVLEPIVKFPLPVNLATSSFAIIPLTWNMIGFPVASYKGSRAMYVPDDPAVVAFDNTNAVEFAIDLIYASTGIPVPVTVISAYNRSVLPLDNSIVVCPELKVVREREYSVVRKPPPVVPIVRAELALYR